MRGVEGEIRGGSNIVVGCDKFGELNIKSSTRASFNEENGRDPGKKIKEMIIILGLGVE